MTELSPKAKELLEQAKLGLTPPAAKKASVWHKVHSDVQGASASTTTGLSGVTKGLLAAVAVVGLGTAVWFLNQTAGTNTSLSTVVAMSPDASTTTLGPVVPEWKDTPTVSLDAKVTSEEEEAIDMEPVVLPKKTNARGDGDLLLEQRWIAAAQREIRAGEFEKSLEILRRHQRRFPEGKLAPERLGATAIALCLSKDISAGREKAEVFLQRYATSPLAPRVRRNCFGDTKTGE